MLLLAAEQMGKMENHLELGYISDLRYDIGKEGFRQGGDLPFR